MGTEFLMKRVMSLPTGTAIGPNEVERVCALIRFAISNGPEINDRLSEGTEKIISPNYGMWRSKEFFRENKRVRHYI